MYYNKISISTQHLFEELESYREYIKEKELIRKKYPTKPWEVHKPKPAGRYKDPYTDEWWNDWQSYKKEITDLILKPNGNFQTFMWELISEKDEEERDRKAKGVRRSIYY